MLEVATTKAGWTAVAFGDVVRQVKDKVDPEESGLGRYIAGGHMDTDDLRIRRWGVIGEDYLGPAFHMRFKPDHVLYGSRRTYLRKVALADFEGITANTTYVLESRDPDVLLPELLPFIMQSESFNAHSKRESKGSVNPYVNFSDLAWYEFSLPPLEEQRRIAEVLQAAQNLKERMRFAQDALYNVSGSWIENQLASNEWPECIAAEVLNRAAVGIVIRPAELYVPEGKGVPALRSLNIAPHRVVMDDCVNISHEGHRDHKKSELQPGDLVIVRSGTPGDAAVIPEGMGELNCIDLIIATPGKDLRSEFLCAVLNSRYGRRQFASGIAGTAQKHFNVGMFKKLNIPVPKLETQDAFILQLQQLQSAVASLDVRRATHKDLFKRLLEECLKS